MKHLLIVALTVTSILSAPAIAQESDITEKMALARDYTTSFPVEDDITAAIDNMVLQVPTADRVLLKSILERNINIERLQTASELALTEVFTEEELKALVAFYKTEEGRAVKEKMPVYQQKIQPVLEDMLRQALQEFSQQKK